MCGFENSPCVRTVPVAILYRSVQHKSINNCDSKYIVVALNKEGIELLSMQKSK